MERAWHIQEMIKGIHCVSCRLRRGIVSVCSSLYVSSLEHTCWHKGSSQQDLRDKDWIDIFLGNSWRNFESRDWLDVAYCPPLCSSPNYIQALGLLVTPGYSRPLAAQLFQTFLTAVKYLNGSWRGESLHKKGRKKECRPLQPDQVLNRRSELVLWQRQD